MLLLITLTAFLVSCVVAAKPPQDPVDRTCQLIKDYHCDFFNPDPRCGTDGVTYSNMCQFSKAHCQVRELHVAHDGHCMTSGLGPGTLPGGQAVYDFFCKNLEHQQCGTDQEIVCGSDDVTYTNLCLFEKARCGNNSLTVASYLACPN
ncbi:ovomucoid-like [Littorina saxatilis]|uniref:Kazal-like domain-containing protein n=1 Tax=Littorina saxatilis TaxID=31220 RepID=A0AAN9AL52_9CAEN